MSFLSRGLSEAAAEGLRGGLRGRRLQTFEPPPKPHPHPPIRKKPETAFFCSARVHREPETRHLRAT